MVKDRDGSGADRAGTEIYTDPVHGLLGNEPGLACTVQADLAGNAVGIEQVLGSTA
ncbi:hypothetical protein AB0D11_42595 [Streptomyces monashensis]|uniref:hypothetical protein n=1 Tax=Streptomyces monashensis TaxID=1678012 RepID=UPI0033D12ED8